jgi:hypothetical protein
MYRPFSFYNVNIYWNCRAAAGGSDVVGEIRLKEAN